ncbi:MAG TPA: hypothetical protein IAA27_11385 [Candidatus Enterococcus stercoravium]|nr:hypothetical protein [Candidatus Enterococcus stercoravium]
MIQLGLTGVGPVKVIVRGHVEKTQPENGEGNEASEQRTLPTNLPTTKIAVVSVVFLTLDATLAETCLRDLKASDPSSWYMVYSCPWDTDLTTLAHCPSVAVTAEDFQ